MWHRLREGDFGPVEGFEGVCSAALVELIRRMLAKEAGRRPSAGEVWGHGVVSRARSRMDAAGREEGSIGDWQIPPGRAASATAGAGLTRLSRASPLAGEAPGYLGWLLGGDTGAMDVSA